MAATRIIFVTIIAILILLISRSHTCADDSKPDSNTMTKWGPKLKEEELAAIAKLSTQELAEMLRTGDTLHAFAALEQLKSQAHGGIQKNFELLLNIASQTRERDR